MLSRCPSRGDSDSNLSNALISRATFLLLLSVISTYSLMMCVPFCFTSRSKPVLASVDNGLDIVGIAAI